MIEVLTLIGRTWVGSERRETRRDVLASTDGIGYREFYAAHGTDYHPEIKFRLADALDYQSETLCEYNGILYRILRTYPLGQALELTCERAPAGEEEDG